MRLGGPPILLRWTSSSSELPRQTKRSIALGCSAVLGNQINQSNVRVELCMCSGYLPGFVKTCPEEAAFAVKSMRSFFDNRSLFQADRQQTPIQSVGRRLNALGD